MEISQVLTDNERNDLVASLEVDAQLIRAAIEAFMRKHNCVVDSVDCTIVKVTVAGRAPRTSFGSCVVNARYVIGHGSEIPIRVVARPSF